MIQTPNLGLEKYELTDAANLADGYNNSMDTLDKFAGDTNAHFPVKTNDIADNAITNAKLNNGAVTTDKIVDANVTSPKLATDSVTTEKIADGVITPNKLANYSITNTKIANYSISNLNISDGITVIFGDSWGAEPYDAWVNYFHNKVKGDLRNYCISGAQFLGEDNSTSIASQINNFVNDKSIDKSFVKTVIIICGVNDYLFSKSDADAHGENFRKALNKLYSVVKSSVPTFWFANFSWNYNSTIPSQLSYHYKMFRYHVRTVFPISYIPLHDKFNVNELYTGDWYHLNTEGMYELADIIYNTIFGVEIITRPFLTYKFHVKGSTGTDQDVIFNQYIEGNKEYKSIELTRADLFNAATSDKFTLTEIEGNGVLSNLSYHIDNNSIIVFNLKVANNFRLCTLYNNNVYNVIIDNDIYSYFHIDTINMQLSIENKTRNNGAPSKTVTGASTNVSFDYHEYNYQNV